MKQNLRVGNGFEADVTQGPLINKNAIQKVSPFLFIQIYRIEFNFGLFKG
jgi:acyl-CoA reductase-like NAD-dependent aldehyde dehydrogenase